MRCLRIFFFWGGGLGRDFLGEKVFWGGEKFLVVAGEKFLVRISAEKQPKNFSNAFRAFFGTFFAVRKSFFKTRFKTRFGSLFLFFGARLVLRFGPRNWRDRMVAEAWMFRCMDDGCDGCLSEWLLPFTMIPVETIFLKGALAGRRLCIGSL